MKVIVGGLATEYQDEGNGPVILMLHGWGNTLHVFDGIVPALSKTRRVVRLDLPGFGATERPSHPWNVEDYSRFVAQFAEKLKLEIDVLVGYSLGGRIAIKGFSHGMFSAHRCVLIAAAGVAERKTLRNRVYVTAAKIGKFLLWPLPHGIYERARKLLYAGTGSDYSSIVGSMSETFKLVVEEDLSANATGVKVPSLLIWGRNDIVTPLSEGEKLDTLIRDSRMTVIEGASHFVLQEKPDEIVKLIQQFI